MMNEIIKARNVLTTYIKEGVALSPSKGDIMLRQAQNDCERSVYNLKRHCIQESLYGVDIDPGAIDIAKLRLWLSLVVDEDDYHTIQPLPNLDYKIMQGNSLIEEFHGISLDIKKKKGQQIGVFAEQSKLDALIEDLYMKQADFFNATHPREKQKRKKDVEQTIFNIFHHEIQKKKQVSPQEAEEIEMELREMTHGNKVRNFFPWKLYFADVFREKGGFDVVIANPPYIQLQANNGELANLYNNKGFKTFKRTGDIYCLFYELGCESLKEKGYLCYITSNKWMRTGYGDFLRKYFSIKNPLYLLEFDSFKVFENVTVNTNILVVQNKENDNRLEAIHFENDYKKDQDIKDYFESRKVVLENLSADPWFIGTKLEISLKKKIERIGTVLKDWDLNIYRGIVTGCNEAFIIDEAKRDELIQKDQQSVEIIKPILRGQDINRYSYEFVGLYVIATFPSLHLDINIYPAVRDLLKSFGRRLEQSGESYTNDSGLRIKCRKKTNHKWFETQDNIAYNSEFEKVKIACGNLSLTSRFSLVDAGVYVNAPSPFITPASKYILAILNSKLGDWYIRSLGVTRSGGYFEYKPMFIEKLPIPQIQKDKRLLFENLVDHIIKAKNTDHIIDTCELEAEIDRLVYKLYGLTEEEIRLIEESLTGK